MNETVSQVSRFLKLNKWHLVTAESCTGGWVAKVMTDLAGSSDCFDRGFVTYSNAAKRDMLGVSKTTLDTSGAVSEEVVREMVKGALERSVAQIAVAISGIAGPGGGMPHKPVGTVCFAWQKTGEQPRSATLHFEGDRDSIRRQSVDYALKGILLHFE